MREPLDTVIDAELASIKAAGLYKHHRVLESRQGNIIRVGGKELVNFCANNYLGLSGRQEMVDAAKRALDEYGYGLSSVRFICGTQTLHGQLEAAVASFIGKEACITFTSCWDANEAVFAALLTEADAIVTDALNHASIIDGVRLCKAERHIFQHMDMADLEQKLRDTQSKRLRCIVTDGVFSMDGDVAPLVEICDLAEKYHAYVVVDDSHATGFMGDNGRGTPELRGVMDRVDIITTTFGKALGGANGGCIVGPANVVELLHQRARTTLFSNALPPVVCGATIFALDFIQKHPELREKLWENTRYFRAQMVAAGFRVPQSEHPIVPIMIGEGKAASDMAHDMLDEGIYVIGFSYPVVPQGKARIRVQISALHTREQIDQLLSAFRKLGAKYGIIASA